MITNEELKNFLIENGIEDRIPGGEHISHTQDKFEFHNKDQKVYSEGERTLDLSSIENIRNFFIEKLSGQHPDTWNASVIDYEYLFYVNPKTPSGAGTVEYFTYSIDVNRFVDTDLQNLILEIKEGIFEEIKNRYGRVSQEYQGS